MIDRSHGGCRVLGKSRWLAETVDPRLQERDDAFGLSILNLII